MAISRRRLRGALEAVLLGVLGDYQDVIASQALDTLPASDMMKIIRWGSASICEASDNPCRARCAPRCLRDLLPSDHYLQTWRVPKKRARHATHSAGRGRQKG